MERSPRSGMAWMVMRIFQCNRGRHYLTRPWKRDKGDGASRTDRREWSRARSTIRNSQMTNNNRGAPLTESISPESRRRAEIWPQYTEWVVRWPGYGSLGASIREPAGGRWWRELQEGYKNREMKGRLCATQPRSQPV